LAARLLDRRLDVSTRGAERDPSTSARLEVERAVQLVETTWIAVREQRGHRGSSGAEALRSLPLEQERRRRVEPISVLTRRGELEQIAKTRERPDRRYRSHTARQPRVAGSQDREAGSLLRR
jgi:hypothetical protein